MYDEEWIRIVNQKEGKGLLLEEIVSEFEIIPYKRGMGYKIGAERLEIKYTTCVLQWKRKKECKQLVSILLFMKRMVIKWNLILKMKLCMMKMKYVWSRIYFDIINEEGKERKELILNVRFHDASNV